jgi:hypothetical protein
VLLQADRLFIWQLTIRRQNDAIPCTFAIHRFRLF